MRDRIQRLWGGFLALFELGYVSLEQGLVIALESVSYT